MHSLQFFMKIFLKNITTGIREDISKLYKRAVSSSFQWPDLNIIIFIDYDISAMVQLGLIAG